MKILFILGNAGAFIFYESVVRKLIVDGHEVEVWHGNSGKAGISDRMLKACCEETGHCRARILSVPRTLKNIFIGNCRVLVNYEPYRNPAHPSPWMEKRNEKNLSAPFRRLIRIPLIRQIMLSRAMRAVLKKLERTVRADAGIKAELAKSAPNLIFASPYIYPNSNETEYVKAARELGIATVAAVQSWDNLSTKGAFHVLPDWIMVWNEALKKEAVTLHRLPPERVLVTGAPRFDGWLAQQVSRSREEFSAATGMGSHRYMLYLCSSNAITGDETGFVREFAAALRDDPSTADLFVMVRPYPSNSEIWRQEIGDNVIIWPPKGEVPDAVSSRADFYDSLAYCEGAVGVNTTAFLEAAMADRPCLTIMNGRYRRTQEELAHFKHLEDGGFIEAARSFEEAAGLCAAIVAGADDRKIQRRNFVLDFIRPGGMEAPAGDLMAAVLEKIAHGELTP